VASEHHTREQVVFFELMDLPPAQASRALRERCGGDRRLRERVERLLRAHREAGASETTSAGAGSGVGLAGGEAAEAPDTIGVYRVVRTLGEGGMGVVYEGAQEAPIRRRVAIKLIKPGMDSREVVRRFEMERQALALMNHPGIASIIDAGLHEGRPYFVMELVEGESVTRYCESRGLGLVARLELFERVVEAVQHAHGKGVIHRDLKPSNILVAERDGRPDPKVIDFGIAKALDSGGAQDTVFTRQGAVLGTPAYMSPEQLGSGGEGVDTRTDVYALGVVLYELLVGRPPFDPRTLASSGFETARRMICDVDPARPSAAMVDGGGARGRAWRSALRRDLDWVVMRCLEKDRRRRYQSASAVGADLGRYRRGEAVEAGPPSTAYRVGKLVKRHRAPAAAAGLALLGLVGGLVGTSLALAEASSARDEARSQARIAEEQRSIAEQEAARAGAVSEFLLNGLLESVDPKNAADAELTMREALDNAAGALGGRFEDQPLTEAAVRSMVGSMYEKLSRPRESAAQQRRVIELYERGLGPADLKTLTAMDQLATSLMGLRELEEAVVVLDEEIERIRSVGAGGGEGHREALLRASGQRATVALMQERYEEAAPLLEGVLELKLEALGAAHQSTLSTMHNLAGLRYALGEYERAHELYERASRGREEAFGAGDPATLLSKSFAASSLDMTGRHDEALELLEDTVGTAMASLGPVHRATHQARTLRARLLHSHGSMEEAVRELRSMREDELAALGPDHMQVSVTTGLLGEVLVDLERYAEAESCLSESLRVQESYFGAFHSRPVRTRGYLVRAIERQGRGEEAESIAVRWAESAIAELGPEHPTAVDAVRGVTALYRSRAEREPGRGWENAAAEWETRLAAGASDGAGREGAE